MMLQYMVTLIAPDGRELAMVVDEDTELRWLTPEVVEYFGLPAGGYELIDPRGQVVLDPRSTVYEIFPEGSGILHVQSIWTYRGLNGRKRKREIVGMGFGEMTRSIFTEPMHPFVMLGLLILFQTMIGISMATACGLIVWAA